MPSASRSSEKPGRCAVSKSSHWRATPVSSKSRFDTLAALLLLCPIANAAPVVLNCISNTDAEATEEVVIRFDEAAGTFELYGKSMWSIRTDKDDGGAAVKEVKFTDDSIVVQFKRRGVLFVNVWAIAASGGRTGTLDRVAGSWTLGKHVYQCKALETTEKQF
jgi:hypothetical protein